MQIDFILPDIGEGIVECELVEWLVKEGDQIVEDQPVADVMTDKALVQIPAMHSGKVTKLYYQQGEIAKVHTPLFALLPEGASEPLEEAVSTAVVAAPPVASGEAQGSQLKDFILPDIGEGIVECELVEWLVKEGDWVEEDQPVADVMTDKALVQIPSMDSGRIHKLYYRQGEIAKVHSPLFAIEVATEATPSTHSATPAATSPAQPQASHYSAVANAQPSLARPGKALASPAVRRLAREHNLDLSQIPGSGKDGRVLKEDILQWQQGQQQSKSCPAKALSPTQSAVPNSNTGDRVEPIRGIRAAMARQMVDSVSTIPHFTYAEEIDVTALDALRQQLKGRFAEAGLKLTAMPLIMKAMALAIRDFPVLNARVNDDCTELTYLDSINIGMAVDTPIGLLVPNVKRVQDKSLKEVTAEVNRLTESARAGRVSPEDLKGGTISISNIGALGGTVATPIINKPEVAIVALGKIQTLPRFNSAGQVEARKIMQVSWSGDHRVIDGGTIARFCNQWKTYLEDPVSMLSELR